MVVLKKRVCVRVCAAFFRFFIPSSLINCRSFASSSEIRAYIKNIRKRERAAG